MSEEQRVIYFVGTKKDGSLYPGCVTLYPLEMESIEDGMDLEQRKQVYRENYRRAAEKFCSFDAYKNHRVRSATGCYGHITTKDGQPKKIVDVVNAFLSEKGKDSIFNKPIGLFYNFTYVTALHQQFSANPEYKEKFDKNTAFFDNNAVYPGKISPAEAMNLYAYLDRTNQLEKVLGNFPAFRKTVLNEYYIPQIENEFRHARLQAGRKYYDENRQPKSPEAKRQYAQEVAKAEEKRAKAYEKLGISYTPQNTGFEKKVSGKDVNNPEITKPKEINKQEIPQQEAVKPEPQKTETEVIQVESEPLKEKKPAVKSKRARKNLFQTNSYKLKVVKEMLKDEDRISSLSSENKEIASKHINLDNPQDVVKDIKKGETRVVIASSDGEKTTMLVSIGRELLSSGLANSGEITILAQSVDAAAEIKKYIAGQSELCDKGIHVSTVDIMARSLIDRYSIAKMPEFFDKDSQCDLLNHSVYVHNSNSLYHGIKEQIS